MSAYTNFLQWDPPQLNMETDATFAGDGQRNSGATDPSEFASALANKLFYQATTMSSALAQAMVAKGYSPVDGTSPLTPAGPPSPAVIALATVLENIITLNDFDINNLPYPTTIQSFHQFTITGDTENHFVYNWTVGPLKVNSVIRITIWYTVTAGQCAELEFTLGGVAIGGVATPINPGSYKTTVVMFNAGATNAQTTNLDTDGTAGSPPFSNTYGFTTAVDTSVPVGMAVACTNQTDSSSITFFGILIELIP
jgi:hypothetical protein